MSRATVLALLGLAACAHSSERGTHATALKGEPGQPRGGDGTITLAARYTVEGMRSDNWQARVIRLTAILDDVPFAAMVVTPREVGHEQVEVHAALDGHLPPVVVGRIQRSLPVRVRLRGELQLTIGPDTLVIPTDDELAVSLGASSNQPTP
jgi:hypothetical protein